LPLGLTLPSRALIAPLASTSAAAASPRTTGVPSLDTRAVLETKLPFRDDGFAGHHPLSNHDLFANPLRDDNWPLLHR
jgi:hypothetical protein